MANKKKTTKQKLAQEKKKINKLMKMIGEERQKAAGYEQVAKVHSAYISILLKKLGAIDNNNSVTITQTEVKEALKKYEARAMVEPTNNSYKLYCEVIE